jgi:hypothetical protein
MRRLHIIVTLGLTLLFFGCSREPVKPLSFYLSEQKPTYGDLAIPTNLAALVVSRLQFITPDMAQHTISIRLLPADASAIEKLTTDNFGKTVVMVQGTNVLSVSSILAPVPAQADFMFPVNTNLDFGSVCRELSNLSR